MKVTIMLNKVGYVATFRDEETKFVDIAASDYWSIYDRIWYNNPETNLVMLRHMERELNCVLSTRGFLSANDVFERFGIIKTRIGQVYGWTLGDVFEFDIFNLDFINGYGDLCTIVLNVHKIF